MSKRLNYAAESMHKAIEAVRNGTSQRAACRQFGIPRGTLQDKLAGRTQEGRKMGPNTILTEEEEQMLTDWIMELSKAGFPRKKNDVLNTVMKIVKDDRRKTPFRDDRPGDTWFKSFLRRHPVISIRTAETVNKARAGVTEENIRKWFQNMEKFLEKEGHRDILEDGSRIINADETNFQMCPKSGKILGPKGWKNIYEIAHGNEKETLTVLGTFNGSGECLKGMIVYPYMRPPKDLVQSVPENWAIGLSDSGWMKSETFYEYVANILHPWLLEHQVKLPVLFIVDGHKTHLTYHLSTFCSQHGIILYCLFPNATHILQPADVSVFRPLKHEWKKHVRTWQLENPGKTLSRKDFAPVLDKALQTISPQTISNGFKACGLFPFNPNAVDFSKCISNNNVTKNSSHNLNEKLSNVEVDRDVGDYIIALSVIENLLHQGHGRDVNELLDTIKAKCKQTDPTRIISPTEDREVLPVEPNNSGDDVMTGSEYFPIGNSLQPIDISTDITDPSNELPVTTISHIDKSTEEVFIQPIHEEPATLATTDVDCLLSQVLQNLNNSKTLEVPSENEGRVIVQSPRVSPAFSKHLFWPVENKAAENAKTTKRKLPYAVSSTEWQKMYQEKEENAKAEEKAKQKRKEERENKKKTNPEQHAHKKRKSLSAASSLKTTKRPKNSTSTSTTIDSSLSSVKETITTSNTSTNDAPCLYCGEFFSQSKAGEGWIQCFLCENWAHENCAGTLSDASFTCELCANK